MAHYHSPANPVDRNWLWGIFARIDRDGNGRISAIELQEALSNGSWTPFNPETVRLMIGMFDKNCNGTIDYNEFSALWQYVTDWQRTFRSYDRDNSNSIDQRELGIALRSFGYNISERLLGIVLKKFDRSGTGTIRFDDFIQCCVVLQTLTNSFKFHDHDQNGWITIGYEQFLAMVFSTKCT